MRASVCRRSQTPANVRGRFPLRGDFAPTILRSAGLDVCLGGRRANHLATHAPVYLTPRDVALRLKHSLRTAQRLCEAWSATQHDPARPRVRLVARPHRRGRPGYRVDAQSLERWLRGAAASNDTVSVDVAV